MLTILIIDLDDVLSERVTLNLKSTQDNSEAQLEDQSEEEPDKIRRSIQTLAEFAETNKNISIIVFFSLQSSISNTVEKMIKELNIKNINLAIGLSMLSFSLGWQYLDLDWIHVISSEKWLINKKILKYIKAKVIRHRVQNTRDKPFKITYHDEFPDSLIQESKTYNTKKIKE